MPKNISYVITAIDQFSLVATKVDSALSKLRNKIEKTSLAAGKVSNNINQIGKSIMALGAPIAAIGALGVKSADDQLKAEALLKNALGKRSEVLLKLADHMEKVTRFGNEQIIGAEASAAALLRQNFNYKTMVPILKKLTPLIVDFASAQNLDLNSAAQIVTKSFTTSMVQLGRYGLTVKGTANDVQRFTSIVKGLKNSFGGAAKAMGQAGIGPMIILKNLIGDLWKEIGFQLIPIIDKFAHVLIPIVEVIGDWLPKHKFISKIIMGVAAVVAVMGTFLVVTKMISSAWKILDVILLDNPFSLIVLGIALLTYEIINAYKHSKVFRAIIHDLWSGMKSLGSVVMENVRYIGHLINMFESAREKANNFANNFAKNIRKHLPHFLGGIDTNVNVKHSLNSMHNTVGMKQFLGGIDSNMNVNHFPRKPLSISPVSSNMNVNNKMQISLNDPGKIVKSVSNESDSNTDFDVGHNMVFGSG